jgi:GTP-binding protein
MPGRTQHLNYFRLDDGKYLVDLPGYGFAKAPAEIRAQWEGLLAPYLIHRSALAGLALIMDSRHPLTDLDRQMIDWFAQTGKPIHVLLSKADKLTRTEQAQVIRSVREGLATLSDRCSVQLFSSLKHTGVAEAEKVLGTWLGLDIGESEAAPAIVSGPPGKVARPRQRKVQGWAARSAGKEKAAVKNKKPPVA